MQIVSSNPSWGFFGTVQSNYGLSDADTATLFATTGAALVSAQVVGSNASAVEFLDGRLGRHFADALSFRVSMPCSDLAFLEEAAREEIAREAKSWSKWLARISR